VKIGIFMVRHPATRLSPILPQTIQILREWGACVEVIYPEEMAINLARVRIEHDLYVLKSGTELALSFAGALHAAGAVILNPYPVTAVMRDKIAGTGVLLAAGISIPETYVAANPGDFEPLLEDGPLIFKPYRGSEGRGIRIVRRPSELAGLAPIDGLLYAQRYYQPDGFDRKIYCIGGQLFGVLRTWPVRTYADKVGAPFTLAPDLRDIALRCGRAFGIDLFGIDIIESGGKAWVVDFASFPGFKGVPDAGLRLADYIYTTARRVLKGQPLTPFREEAA
jgi:ribosomal protein S6--L-glutamate ligase